MSLIAEILDHNEQFVRAKAYEKFRTDQFPNKRLVIVTCMDTRLVELLPRAMNVRNGDVKMIKIAGAIVSHPFGSVMRSILVAIYQLEAQEVAVIGHHECGMVDLTSDKILDKARAAGVTDEVLRTLDHSGIGLEKWLTGFKTIQDGIRSSVELIRQHPLLPPNIPVHGLIMHPATGRLELLIDGYAGVKEGKPRPAAGI